MINAEVERTNNENPLSMLRRFNKRVQGVGVVKRVRSKRYKSRSQSSLSRKKHAINKLSRRKEVDLLIRLGKMTEKAPRR